MQQFSEIIEAQKAKIEEFSAANKGLARGDSKIRKSYQRNS